MISVPLPSTIRARRALRRSVGGTLMAWGWVLAFLFAIFTGWLLLDTLFSVMRGTFLGFPLPQVLVGTGGAVGGIGVAGLGRLVLGRRVDPR